MSLKPQYHEKDLLILTLNELCAQAELRFDRNRQCRNLDIQITQKMEPDVS